MKKISHQTSGFTIIELIMVITILGFLSVVAIPQYIDLTARAQTANEQGVVGGIRAGIATQLANDYAGGDNTPEFPATLDAVTAPDVCDEAPVGGLCFATVIPGGITDGNWSKLTATTYRSPANATNIWTYTPATGSFTKTTT